MEDCRIGKELKQATCRYVKECKRGWTRNDKFICRKTERRLKDPNEPIRKFTTKGKLSRIEENSSSPKPIRQFTKGKLSRIEENSQENSSSPKPIRQFTKGKNRENLGTYGERPIRSFTSRGKSRLNSGTFSKLKSKLKVGNSFVYAHPDGRTEKVKVTGVGPKGLEIGLPNFLANEWNNGPKFKKNQKVFYIYKNGTKEQGTIQKVYADEENYKHEYDVQLLTPPRIKRLKERNLRAMSDYRQIDKFPYYVLKNA